VRERRRHRVSYRWFWDLMRLNCGEGWFDTLNRYNAKQRRCRKPMVSRAHFLAANIYLNQPELDLQTVVTMCEEIERGDR
jgi:hypothetical protein